ncbi:MAG: hypothetical protein HXS44_16865 [Theionarchaea archaeon]|nr:hypothetical protein [Theionarchaea archaeon]
MRRLLLVVLLLSLLAPVYGEDVLTMRITTDKKTYEAGDWGYMDVIFTNNSEQLVEDLEAEVKSNDILFFNKTGTIESLLYGSETLQFKFQCKNLEDGNYKVTVYYGYTATSKQCQGGVCQQVKDKKTYEITVRNGEPRISLETNTLDVKDNKTVIIFRNSGETAIDFQFQILSDLQLQYEQYIGYVLSTSSKEIVVYGEPGEYQGSVLMEYRDRFGRTYERTLLIKIVIKGHEEILGSMNTDMGSNDEESKNEGNRMFLAQPTNSVPEIRKIQLNTVPPQSKDVSQYYVYIMVFSCLFLISGALMAKLKNVKN